MDKLIEFAVHNTIFALVLAPVVFLLTRAWRNPLVAHTLWVLVLLRMVAPPVMPIGWATSGVHDWNITGPVQPFKQSSGDLRGIATMAPAQQRSWDAAESWNVLCRALLTIWLAGSTLCAVVAVSRIVRFQRRLRGTLPASQGVQQMTRGLSRALNVRSVPDVRLVEFTQVPLVWCAGGKPVIALPMPVVRDFDQQQLAMIMAHELAHLRRRDHWVRGIELIVTTIYWWNPLVWIVRRQIHQAEDICCDAWVRMCIVDCTRSYAEVVLKIAESLSPKQVAAQLLPASPFLRSLTLKRRIEMILESRFAPQFSRKSMFATMLVAFLVLPPFIQATGAVAQEKPAASRAAASDDAATSELPYEVKFEQGATSFKPGDDIKILEVRGTAETFKQGNIYWIRGTYALASKDRALLAAFVTANNVADGTGRSFRVQTKYVDKGNGTFTLFLPMACEGLPHVSFYDGESFGGNYFGTGDSVLKKYWGEK